MKRSLLAVTIVVSVTACTDRIENLTCRDIEADAIDMSKGGLIKITNAHLVRRSSFEIVCHGMGIFADNSDIPVTYRAYIDEDHEIMVSVRTGDYEADTVTQRDSESASQAFNQLVDQIYNETN